MQDATEDDLDFLLAPADEDAVDVPIGAEDDVFVYDEEAQNLCEEFEGHPIGRDAKKLIEEEVFNNYTTAWNNASEWRDQCAADMEIFRGHLEEKEFPFEDCANPHLPIMFESVTRIHARGMGELFGDWSKIIDVLPITNADREQAQLMTKHDNWQLNHVITDFKRQMDRGFLMFLINGESVCHSYYDKARGRNVHQMLTSDEFFAPAVFTSTEPDLSDMPFYGRVMHMYRHELQGMATRGGWYGIEEILEEEAAALSSEPDQPYREAVAEVEGIHDEADGSVGGTYTIVWYEGWTRHLPGQDSDRFVQVMFHLESRKVVFLRILEEVNWVDRMRHKQQTAQRDEYIRKRDAYHQEIAQRRRKAENNAALLQDETVGPEFAAAIEQENVSLEMMPPQPVPYEWMGMASYDDEVPEPRKPRKEPVRLWYRGTCVEPLLGNLGIGYGNMLANYNRAANQALAQYTDSATLGNAPVHALAQGVDMERGMEITPGAFLPMKNLGPAELATGIRKLDFGKANDQLIEVMRIMMDAARGAMQAPDVLSGEPGKSGETFRGIAARIEQATKQLSVTSRKFADMLVGILKNNAKLNAVYLPDHQTVHLNNPATSTVEPVDVGRHMWERDYRVEIRSDLRYTSSAQRIHEADELVGMGDHPYLANNAAFQHRAIAEALKARGREDMVQLMGKEPEIGTLIMPPEGAGPISAPGAGAPGQLAPPSPGPQVAPSGGDE